MGGIRLTFVKIMLIPSEFLSSWTMEQSSGFSSLLSLIRNSLFGYSLNRRVPVMFLTSVIRI